MNAVLLDRKTDGTPLRHCKKMTATEVMTGDRTGVRLSSVVVRLYKAGEGRLRLLVVVVAWRGETGGAGCARRFLL